MIDSVTLTTYTLIVLGFVFVPGPATLLILARASTGGTRIGLATGVGIAMGDVVHTAMAILGLSAILLASAFWFSVIKYLGAAYLVYLGVKALMARGDGLEMPTSGRGPLTAGAAMRQAVLVEVLNPKSALFFLAFLPQFVDPAAGQVPVQLLTLGVIFILLGMVSTFVVAVAAGTIGGALRRNPTIVRWQNRAVGLLYCGLGVRLALQERG